MSGGRKIDDHSFWAGKGGRGSVFPMEAKMKEESSAEGAGAVREYEDTTEAIKRVQEAGEKKAAGRPLKPGYRY